MDYQIWSPFAETNIFTVLTVYTWSVHITHKKGDSESSKGQHTAVQKHLKLLICWEGLTGSWKVC